MLQQQAAPMGLGHNSFPRNAGTALQVEWFENHQVNTSAAERRAATLTTRRRSRRNTRPPGW